MQSLEDGLGLNQVDDRKGHFKRSRGDSRGKGLEVGKNMVVPGL